MIDVKTIEGATIVTVPITKDAISHEELMTSDYVQLSWEIEFGYPLPMGAYIEHNGERYSLLAPYYPTMKSEEAWLYTPKFHSRIMRWQKIIVPVYTYNDNGSVKLREFDWSYVGTPSSLMNMIIRTIENETGETWGLTLQEELPETIEITAQSTSVWSLLSEVAEKCDTEWWADKSANWLYLSKCSRGAELSLEVGDDVGLPSITSNDAEYFTRFYAFGSTRNITQDDGVVQGSLVNKRLTLDPNIYPNGYKDTKGHFEGGKFVSDLLPEEVLVTSLYFDDIYPSSKLTISSVRKRMKYRVDEDGNKIRKGGTDLSPIYEQYAIWYFQIHGFAFDESMIIKGLPLSVSFQSGNLRGREFELTYHSTDKVQFDKADVNKDGFLVKAGDFEIIFDESSPNGMIIPDVDYIVPEVLDEVVIFNIEMPEEYKASARKELEEALDKKLAKYRQDNNVYEFNSNPIAFYEKDIDVTLGQRIYLGYSDGPFSTRVTMVEKHLDYPIQQRIRVSNTRTVGSRQQLRDEVRNATDDILQMGKVDSFLGMSTRNHSRELMLSAGRYFAMRDSLEMLEGAVGGFTTGVNPLTVETMAILVGDESLQFRFTQSRTDLTPITNHCPLTYDASAKQLNAEACALVHMTLGIKDMTTVRDVSEYKSWDMEEWHSAIFDDAEKRYYVYAKCPIDGSIGTYDFFEKPKLMKPEEENFYYFLIGMLNAEYVGTRELVTMFGFTEVRPAQITTDVLRDSVGNLMIDLLNATITAQNGAKIIGDMEFGANSKGLSNLSEWADVENAARYNLLSNSASYTIGPVENNYYYHKFALPIKVSVGDTFTFKAEMAEAVTGDFTSFTITVYSTDIKTQYADNVSVNVGANTTATFKIDRGGALDSEAVLLIYAGEWNATSNKAIRLTKFSLVKGSIPAAVWEENGSYLFNAFKNGTTKISNGLVMSEAVMVEDEEGVVRGMLNGSSYGEDSTHGRLILAAGSEGSAEANMQAAATRVYGDGHIVSNSMELKDGCTIGDIQVTENGLKVASDKIGEMTIASGSGLSSTNVQKVSGQVGSYAGQWINIVSKRAQDSALGHSYVRPIGVYVCMASDEEAFFCESGYFAGFRSKTRAIQSNTTLNQYDHTIVNINSSAAVTITLPESPLSGQEYKIINKYNTKLTIYGGASGKNIRNAWTGKYMTEAGKETDTASKYFLTTNANMIDVVWDGSEWLASWAH